MKAIILAVLFVAGTAHAGKEERERQTELTPMVKKATEDFKAACGCGLNFNVKWDTFKKANDMQGIKWMAENISSEAKGYCKDADSKKAMCAMKTIDLSYGKEVTVNYASGKVDAKANHESYVNWNMIAEKVDQ